MEAETRQTPIARYKDGYRVVVEALADAKDDEPDARPAPGKWTAREIVHRHAGQILAVRDAAKENR
jgi:hypothetical protein